jgi:hypothetical protein
MWAQREYWHAIAWIICCLPVRVSLKGTPVYEKWQINIQELPYFNSYASDIRPQRMVNEIKRISDKEKIKIHMHLAQSTTELSVSG